MDHNSINGQGQIDTYYQIILEKAPSQIATCNLQFSEMPKIFVHFFFFHLVFKAKFLLLGNLNGHRLLTFLTGQ